MHSKKAKNKIKIKREKNFQFQLKISYYKNIKRIKQSSKLTKTVINKQILVKKSKIVAEHNTYNDEPFFNKPQAEEALKKSSIEH